MDKAPFFNVLENISPRKVDNFLNKYPNIFGKDNLSNNYVLVNKNIEKLLDLKNLDNNDKDKVKRLLFTGLYAIKVYGKSSLTGNSISKIGITEMVIKSLNDIDNKLLKLSLSTLDNIRYSDEYIFITAFLVYYFFEKKERLFECRHFGGRHQGVLDFLLEAQLRYKMRLPEHLKTKHDQCPNCKSKNLSYMSLNGTNLCKECGCVFK
ncbi:TFIIB-type zinc ribbon-containing protein [Candidatus Woesearchaeota archaeon]|nr:TFIIB-type zinc ribbon-containing protein [Candidatus Woesearchaeota archaeon]